MPAKQRKNMKIRNKLAIVTTTAIAAMFITQANAQYRTAGDDGITASPKVRAMLNERVQSTTSVPSLANATSHQAWAVEGNAASPKVRQMLADRKGGSVVAAQPTAVVSAQPGAADGIVASPKLREQLNERSARQIEIAPLR